MAVTKSVFDNFEAGRISKREIAKLLEVPSEEDFEPVYELAREKSGVNAQLYASVNYTNNCRKNCSYCGLRKDNPYLKRYLIEMPEIDRSLKEIEKQSVKTLVLQSGWHYSSDAALIGNIREILSNYDIEVLLSTGGRRPGRYAEFKSSGAAGYILKAETTDKKVFESVHPDDTLEERAACLDAIKKTGFKTGTGFLIGLPGQDASSVAADLMFLAAYKPDYISIGPFLPQQHTPLALQRPGSYVVALRAVAIARIMNPSAGIFAPVSFDALHPEGRRLAMEAGADILMQDYTPVKFRKDFLLYDGRPDCSEISTNRKKAEAIAVLAGKKII